MNNIYIDKTLDTYVIKQEIKDLKGKKYRWVQIFLPETDFVQVLSLSDRLAEERKKVVQMIKAEFEPSPDSTVITGTPTPEAELVNRGFSVCKKRVYKVLDRIERGE